MAAAGVPVEVIRRWGRWLSDCWRRYVFTASETIGDLANRMVEADYTVSMVLEDFKASA